MHKRTLFLLPALAALLFLGNGCWTTTVNSNEASQNVAQTIDVTLTIDKGEDAPAVYTTSVTRGATALELLQQEGTARGFSVTTKDTSYGPLITGIDGVEQTDTVYWFFYVNGESAAVGAGSYTVEENDRIEFRYTAGV